MNVVVIGGGAGGFFGAVTCAESDPSCRVTILEKGPNVLAKVRVSGGGRCNVTYACFDAKLLAQHYPRGGKALLGPYHRFGPQDTISWFEKRGVALKTEADGRIFPVTDRSQTIIDALTDAARQAGVTTRLNTRIVSIVRNEAKGFSIELSSGEKILCDRLLLATGSGRQGYEWAQALGHAILPPVPSLFTFTIDDGRLRGLAGTAAQKAQLRIKGTSLEQSGPVLITHWGLSGPAVLRLSAWGARVLQTLNYQAQLKINWLSLRDEDIQNQLESFRISHSTKLIGGHGPFELPRRLWERLAGVAVAPDQRWADLSKTQAKRLVQELGHGSYEIAGRGVFKEEFVTCGGVRLNQVGFKTMESRVCPGLYFAGEILDIDGITGGFNFQSVWTTAWLAGQAMAKPQKITA
ncbi:MAG: NAD(P)/FAD-dependent oxidoreductase [Elusimicrobia bacterium]|nr:NAD(P)/FAD-dependent oxidoreductase [Elusimicrobiota bacterium]